MSTRLLNYHCNAQRGEGAKKSFPGEGTKGKGTNADPLGKQNRKKTRRKGGARGEGHLYPVRVRDPKEEGTE